MTSVEKILFDKIQNLTMHNEEQKLSTISTILLDLAIPPQVLGYSRLRYAILLALEYPEVVNHMTKVLYPLIAEQFKRTPTTCERNMRHALELGWNRCNKQLRELYFGVYRGQAERKPSLSEFIATIAERLRLA